MQQFVLQQKNVFLTFLKRKNVLWNRYMERVKSLVLIKWSPYCAGVSMWRFTRAGVNVILIQELPKRVCYNLYLQIEIFTGILYSLNVIFIAHFLCFLSDFFIGCFKILSFNFLNDCRYRYILVRTWATVSFCIIFLPIFWGSHTILKSLF